MNFKKIAGLCAVAGLSIGTISGCSARLKDDNYDKVAVASFGETQIYMDEVNFYAKLNQATYDSYYNYFYYSKYNSLKDFYADTSLSGGVKTLWDTLKEDTMSTVWQTYVLCEYAQRNNITLSDDDKAKLEEAATEFLEETNEGIVKACGVDKAKLITYYTQNALANRAWEDIVKGIDTSYTEADYRVANIAFAKVSKATASTEETTASTEEKDETTIDLASEAAKIMAELQEEYAKDSENAFDNIGTKYKESATLNVSVTSSSNVSKPSDTATETYSTYAYKNLKTGDWTTYHDETNDVYYLIYCKNDTDPDGTKSAVNTEMNNRKKTMFSEKYPDIVNAASTFTVNEKVYAQYSYVDIPYVTETTAEATTTATTTTTAVETTASETTAAETTAEETGASETEQETEAEETQEQTSEATAE